MSASQLSTPAHWASWADAMPVLQRQLPSVAATILQALNNLDEAQPCIQAAQAAHQHIHAHGWEPPSWQQVLEQQPPQTQAEAFTGPTQPGWQHHASAPFHRTARAGVYNSIDAASQALLDSQTGPFASRAFQWQIETFRWQWGKVRRDWDDWACLGSTQLPPFSCRVRYHLHFFIPQMGISDHCVVPQNFASDIKWVHCGTHNVWSNYFTSSDPHHGISRHIF